MKAKSGSLLIVCVSPATKVVDVTYKGTKMKKVGRGTYMVKDPDRATVDITWNAPGEREGKA